MLSPLYIAEIAPEKIRGTLVALYQLAIVVGILLVFFVNLQIQRLGDEAWNTTTGWRWMFASLAAPAVLFSARMIMVPESPRWLMKMGRRLDRDLDISDASRRNWPGAHVLGICRLQPAEHAVCAGFRPGDQRPHSRGDRGRLEKTPS
jgi:MFS family permease